VAAPFANDTSFTELEQARLQTWLDGTALGMSQAEIGECIGVTNRTVQRLAARLCDHLGVFNTAGAMYSAGLHGYKPSLRLPAGNQPRLTPSARSQFYLGALGLSVKETARLTHATTTDITSTRSRISRAFGAKNTAQAIALAFELGYFTPLTVDEMQP
jgi:DNA-binding CsgD family transcriptional regulator